MIIVTPPNVRTSIPELTYATAETFNVLSEFLTENAATATEKDVYEVINYANDAMSMARALANSGGHFTDRNALNAIDQATEGISVLYAAAEAMSAQSQYGKQEAVTTAITNALVSAANSFHLADEALLNDNDVENGSEALTV